MRVFFAIELPEAVQQQLSTWRLRLDEALQSRLRWTRPSNLHVTLKFIGDATDQQVADISRALKEITVPSMHLRAADVLFFPQRGPIRIVAAGVQGDVKPLQLLYEAIEQSLEPLGFARERRAFTPHITIARAKTPIPGRFRVSAPAPPTETFHVDSFSLMQSHLEPGGARYTALARFHK